MIWLDNGKNWSEKIAIITNSGKSERGQCGTQTLQLLLSVVFHKAYDTYTHTPKTAYEEQATSKPQAFVEWRNPQHIHHYYVVFHH
jgi:hypothetical protein